MKFIEFLTIILILFLILVVGYLFKGTIDRIVRELNCEPIYELQEYNAYLRATIANLSCVIDCNEAIAPWDRMGKLSCEAKCRLDWFLNQTASTTPTF